MFIVSIESELVFAASSFWREGGWTGKDTWFCTCFLFFKDVGECVNRVTELFMYDTYLWYDLISSHTDAVRSRAGFVSHSLTLPDAADGLDNKCLC